MEERRTTDLYRRAEEHLTSVASAIQRQDCIDLVGLSALATEIADSVRHNDQLVVQALAGPGGSTLVTNLINVSILATKVGVGLGYYGEELRRLSLSGLVHDIGLFAVPPSVVTKSGRLSREERTLIEQHPELGYQVIRKLGQEWDWLAQVVRQAHERWNGQGYPNRLKGRDIHELAQIIGAVDVFDALVTPRPYRRRFFPHEAVRELVVVERLAFPREIIKALVEQLSAYPPGTLVRLTTGEVGTVVGTNPRFPLRPIVEVETGSGQASREVDLSLSPLVAIIETVESPAVARVPF
ncbi:MAG TPA: HD domain-containing phosphohydrolase, partial [Nitrospira sp.]